MKKIIALDIGGKRIGVAVSDGLGMLAHPLTTLKWNGIKKLISDLQEIICEHEAETLVVGIPYTMKGGLSEKTKEVITIFDKLQAALEINLVKIDERLTTKMAENVLHSVGKKPSRHRDKIDQIAAIHILQAYLDKF
ncbi:MAG: Holliday junction resolvase RuvX [Calditrichales bacterium]|nr:Holliday junction resolvase RuvX [Calditrichales bacterium]